MAKECREDWEAIVISGRAFDPGPAGAKSKTAK
jgi:hypothetical protein